MTKRTYIKKYPHLTKEFLTFVLDRNKTTHINDISIELNVNVSTLRYYLESHDLMKVYRKNILITKRLRAERESKALHEMIKYVKAGKSAISYWLNQS